MSKLRFVVSQNCDKMKKSVQFDKPTAASKKEEKKLEKELKRIAKEENQLRDHLIREKNFSKESNLRGWADWESWCKGVKIDELRNDLTAVSQSVSQLIDRTNHTVKTIQMHRVHAEEQYLRNFQNHSELIDYVMGKLMRRNYFVIQTYQNIFF